MSNISVISEHHCKTVDSSENTAINKRDFNGKKRWMWERECDGKIDADEIIHCPYCGEELEINHNEM